LPLLEGGKAKRKKNPHKQTKRHPHFPHAHRKSQPEEAQARGELPG